VGNRPTVANEVAPLGFVAQVHVLVNVVYHAPAVLVEHLQRVQQLWPLKSTNLSYGVSQL
jgi:hypothetical protein